MTVRRDLDVLDDAGLLLKVHGGATLRDERTTDEPGFEAKSLRNMGEKHAIAMAAAAMVRPGGAIGITAGTTTWQLAYHIVDIADLTVVTNSVRVADVLHQARRRRPHRRAHRRRAHSIGRARRPGRHLVRCARLHLDAVFMGVHGISERAGFSTPNLMEAETNRAFVAATDRLIVLADHTKWNVTGLSTIAALSQADTLITDTGNPAIGRGRSSSDHDRPRRD